MMGFRNIMSWTMVKSILHLTLTYDFSLSHITDLDLSVMTKLKLADEQIDQTN